MKWKDIKKIDAHVHILPADKAKEFAEYNGDTHAWSNAVLEKYLPLMEKYNIEKTLLLPVNDMYLYYEDPVKTNNFFAGIKKEYPDKFYAFADILPSGAYFIEDTPYILEKAVNAGLDGLKIHPTNLNMPADDLRLVPVLRKAAELKIPVMFHSNPCRLGFHDDCAPDKINKMIQIFPDIKFITAHLGGMKFPDAISGCSFVDFSFILPKLVKLYGLEQTNRILRMFGTKRLIFGTDFPDGNYEEYFDILDSMDFSDDEKNDIAYNNILKILERKV